MCFLGAGLGFVDLHDPVPCIMQTFSKCSNELVSEQMNEPLKEVFSLPVIVSYVSLSRLYSPRWRRMFFVFCIWNNTHPDWRGKLWKPETRSPTSPRPGTEDVKQSTWKDAGKRAHTVSTDIHLQSFVSSPLIKPAEMMGKLNSSWLALTFCLFETCKFQLFMAFSWISLLFSWEQFVHGAPVRPTTCPSACGFFRMLYHLGKLLIKKV